MDLSRKNSNVFTNITSTFSGIGVVIVDLNSLVLDAIEKYNLELSSLPFSTVYLHYSYVSQNLEKYQIKNILYFYEFGEDVYLNGIIKMLHNERTFHYKEIRETIENKRIALALLSHQREQLNSYFLRTGVYTGYLEYLRFEIPFVFTLVNTPLECNEADLEYSYTAAPEITEQQCSCEQCVSFEPHDFDFMLKQDLRNKKQAVCINLVNNNIFQGIIFDGRTSTHDGRVLCTDDLFDGRTNESSTEDIFKANTPLIPWSGEDIDQLIPPRRNVFSVRHINNVRRSAMSLYDGKFHYSSIIREVPGKVKITSQMKKIIEDNEKRILKEARAKDDVWLKGCFLQFSKLASLKEKKDFLDKIKPGTEYIRRRLLLLGIEVASSLWSLERRKDDPNERVILDVYLKCMEYFQLFTETVVEPELEFVCSSLISAGFESTVLEFMQQKNFKIKNLQFSEKASPKPNDFDLYIQLKYGGDHLKRTLGTRKDKRVPFDPDEWQYQLLNAVDDNKSVVISAPTSSGKTFICFYAIEKILKNSDTDVVVFCLPTKALVNQVTSDVYARFNPKNTTVMLQGTLMPDISNDPFNCQVLITIPSMLESLLNSDSPVKNRIKYIIMDEIHKINEASIGSKIERIIHLAQCPFLLLSATLGNLDSFYNWACKIEKAKGRDCVLVLHSERFCELKTFYFNKELLPLNSMFAYSFNHLKEFGFGNDLHFLPDELLNIYYYIYMVLDKNDKKLIKALAPKNYFKSNIITKKDVAGFQSHLLKNFEEFVKQGILSEDKVFEVYSLLTKDSDKFSSDLSDKHLLDGMLGLLNTLKEKDMLPCIVFNTDRDFVNKLAKTVYAELQSQDITKKKNKAADKFKKEQKRNRDAEKTKNSWIEDSIISEQAMELETKDINYTFLDPATKLTDYDVKQEFASVKHSTPKIFLDMAYRGIGVHHSGMSKHYRSAVEILFRKKHIRVLFATETLALGINMPCRTTIFAGDTLFLDPMNYKQMSGRAGRRGYDTLGNIVFFGISKNRVRNLMVSNLPEIQGAYAYSNVGISTFDIQESLVSNPLFCSRDSGVSDLAAATKGLSELALGASAGSTPSNSGLPTPPLNMHVDFNSVEFRMNLVETQKNCYPFLYPRNYLNDLHLFNREMDPSIFVFSLLFQSNVIPYDTDNFILLISYLFENIPVSSSFKYKLKNISGEVFEYISKINASCMRYTTALYSQELKTLQSYSKTPLFLLKSFLYTSDLPLNSYIYDFFIHGTVSRINSENLISTGILWQALYNVDNVLQSFCKFLLRYYPEDPRYKTVMNIHSVFKGKFALIFA